MKRRKRKIRKRILRDEHGETKRLRHMGEDEDTKTRTKTRRPI